MTDTMLVDGNNLLMRAIFGMKNAGLSSHAGVATGPIVSFINSLSSFIRQEQPKKVVVCWDGGRSERRLILSADYKGNRAAKKHDQDVIDSFDYVKGILSLSNVYQARIGGVEADDIVAWFWRHKDPSERLVIVSNDKDFLQLVEPDVEQIRVSSYNTKTDRWDTDRVVESIGVSPEHMPFYLALVGDVSDNVRGVDGVGPKTAVKIITEAEGDWSKILEHPKVVKHVEQASIALQQVDLRTCYDDLDLPKTPPAFEPQTNKQVYSLLDMLDLEQIKVRMMQGSLWA